MKLHVVHDEEGRITAASVPERGPYGSPIPRPLPGSRDTEAQLDIPDQHVQLELRELLDQVTIDPQSRKPIFKA